MSMICHYCNEPITRLEIVHKLAIPIFFYGADTQYWHQDCIADLIEEWEEDKE